MTNAQSVALPHVAPSAVPVPLHAPRRAGSSPYLRLVELPDPALPVLTVEAAFRENARYAYAIAIRILGNHDEVEDLMQDLFIAATRALGELAHPAAIRRWFAVVTVRIARHRLRRRSLLSFFGDDERTYRDLASTDASPEQRALLSSIYRTLDGLSVDVRLAWSLRHLEGMSLEMVADACGCSLATAKRRIAAAAAVVEHSLGDRETER